MNKQSTLHRRQKLVKSTVPVNNGHHKLVGRHAVVWEGRYVVRNNHAKVGVQHFSV